MPGFSNTWTMNFQMFKLVLEKSEEPEIKLPISIGLSKKQDSSRKNKQTNIYFCFINYAKVFDCVDHFKLWEILKEMGIPDHLTCLLRNLYADQEAIVRTGHGTTELFQMCVIRTLKKRSTVLIIFLSLYWIYYNIASVSCFFFGPGSCGILAVHPEMEHVPPPLRGKVLTTGPPGKCLNKYSKTENSILNYR